MNKNTFDSIPENFSLDDLDQLQIIDKSYQTEKVAVRIGLICSLFVRNPLEKANRLALAQCGDHYQKVVGEHLKYYVKPNGEGNEKPYPPKGISLVEYIMKQDNIGEESFHPFFFADKDPYVASHYGLNIFASNDEPPLDTTPGYFNAALPISWLKEKNEQITFQQLVHQWCKILKPFHGYAGIGAIQSMIGYEADRTSHFVYPLAKRFLGMDIGSTQNVALGMELEGGSLKIKGVNWLTALDDNCFDELGGKEAVLGDLTEGFQFYDYDGGVLIQAGSMPQIGDVNQRQMPKHYQKLARKLKPIRMYYPEGCDQYLIESPNDQEKSHEEVTNEWLARFDED